MPVRKLRFDALLPDQQQEVTLGGTKYQLRASWNPRLRQWYLDALDVEGNPIFTGDAMIQGAQLGANCLNFPHFLIVYAPELQRQEDLWNGNISVWYIQPSE